MYSANTKLNSVQNPYAAHQEIVKLLPWHINQTLNHQEIDKVESHLKVCYLCQQEAKHLRTLANTVANQPFINTSELKLSAKFSTISARINSTAVEKDYGYVSVAGQKSLGFKLGNINLNINGFSHKSGLAMAAAVLLAVLIPRLETNVTAPTEYQTLSNSEIATVQKDAIRVIFLDDSKKQEINALVASVNGQITSGPTEQGEYAVAIKGEITASNVQGVIDNLKKDTNVLFAEPAYAMLSADKSTGN